MCSNSQTHVKAVAIICISLSVICISLLIGDAIEVSSTEIDFVFDKSSAQDLGIEISVYFISLISAILCLIGAIKNKKRLLIPFMIVTCLIILAVIGFQIYYWGLQSPNNHYWIIEGKSIVITTTLLFLGPVLDIYFFVVVVKYYCELSSSKLYGYTEDVVFQRCNSPPIIEQVGGLSNV